MRFGDSKDVKINVRLSCKEYNYIVDYAKDLQCSVGAVIRLLIDSSMIPIKCDDDDYLLAIQTEKELKEAYENLKNDFNNQL